jgi:hypothetical protein
MDLNEQKSGSRNAFQEIQDALSQVETLHNQDNSMVGPMTERNKITQNKPANKTELKKYPT